MRALFRLLFLCAFLIACSDDDSDNFLVRGDTASYSSEEDDELSSSSSRSSSSSEQRSSSSSDAWLDTIPYVSPCRDEEDDNCKYGILADERDGQSYRTVDIGEQTWMAENLNYASESSKCYNDSLEYCDLYGRLYSWADAMEVCPSGWHLPSLDEWKILFTYAGGVDVSASKLRSSYDWECYNCEGTDDYGFSVLPAGGYRTMYNGF
jgi:hypothetical protein